MPKQKDTYWGKLESENHTFCNFSYFKRGTTPEQSQPPVKFEFDLYFDDQRYLCQSRNIHVEANNFPL